jgi:uncharacterized protein (TIGR02117 family)
VIVYVLGGLILAMLAGIGLPHPAGWGAGGARDCPRVEIFVRSNGTHTDLVFPERELAGDWAAYLDLPARLEGVETREPRFLSFGWGEQTFYLEVREWGDLTCGAIWTALVDSPGTVMHVELLGPVRESERMRPVKVCKDDVAKLESYARRSFQPGADQRASFLAPGYGRRDWFYKATGRYSLLTTSNTWTAAGLRSIDVPTPLWSAFAGPILWHLPDAEESEESEPPEGRRE